MMPSLIIDGIEIAHCIERKKNMTNKLDRVIEVLKEDLTADELWHVVYNKMTNNGKMQMISELLNRERDKIDE